MPLACLLLLFTTLAYADSQALRAYDALDYSKAFQLWTQDAKAGDREAQYHLALLYRDGQGVSKDPAEALRWMKMSAEQGYTAALTELGLFFEKGTGVTIDYAEAKKWYEIAVAQGSVRAKNQLGILHLNGRGVPRDYGRAYELFYESAGVSKAAAYNVALMHERGWGRKQDLVEAGAWYSVAMDKGEQGALEKHYEIVRKLSPQDNDAMRIRTSDIQFELFVHGLKGNLQGVLALIGISLTVLATGLSLFLFFSKRLSRRRDPELELRFSQLAGNGWRRWMLLYRPQGAVSLCLRVPFFLCVALAAVTWATFFVPPFHVDYFVGSVVITAFLPVLRWAAISVDKSRVRTLL